MTSVLAHVMLFGRWHGQVEELARAFDEAGFSQILGFEPLRDRTNAPLEATDPPAWGSLLIVDEASVGSMDEWLREKQCAIESMYLLLITESHTNRDQVEPSHSRVRPGYRYIGMIDRSATASSAAAVAVGMIQAARTSPSTTLLWIIDNESRRFKENRCWHQLMTAATNAARASANLTIVPSMVSDSMLQGAQSRRRLVAAWRDHILTPIRAGGGRLVLVTDNHFSPRDSHLGEIWASTVHAFLPQASIFVASAVSLQQREGLAGIWLEGGVLREDDEARIVSALIADSGSTAEEPSGNPRAVALSDRVFSDVWPLLLSQADTTVAAAVKRRLTAGGLSVAARGAVAREAGTEHEVEYADNGLTSVQIDDAPLKILAIATEWSSAHGGLSTFNRGLCTALANVGNEVRCLLPSAIPDHDFSWAQAAGVKLVPTPEIVGIRPSEHFGLYVSSKSDWEPDVIIGHSRFTGPAAEVQRRYHEGSLFVHFVHVSPEEIAAEKGGDNRFADAAERRDLETRLASKADLTVGVGPRLFREIKTALRGSPARIYRLDPGMNSDVAAEVILDLPMDINCLVVGRLEDALPKGLYRAAQALGLLARNAKARYGGEPTFVARGAIPGTEPALFKELQPMLAGLLIRLRAYTPDPEQIARDFTQASVVLMPSTTEGFGLVGLEAIAHGTPVLVTGRSGLADVLAEFLPEALCNHLIVDPGPTEEDTIRRWASALDSLLSDRRAAFQRALEVRMRLLKHLAWDQVAARFTQELRQLAGRQ
jgi:glycosyltransferase involved in cell wall biosynthesis